MFDRGCGQHPIDDARSVSVSRVPFDRAGDPPPRSHDGIADWKNTAIEASFQGIASGGIAGALWMVVSQVMNSFVIFAERENAQIKRFLGLSCCPSFDRGCAIRVNQRGDDIGVE